MNTFIYVKRTLPKYLKHVMLFGRNSKFFKPFRKVMVKCLSNFFFRTTSIKNRIFSYFSTHDPLQKV